MFKLAHSLSKPLARNLLLSCSLFCFGGAEASELEDLFSLSMKELLQIDISTGTSIEIKKAPAIASLITAADIKAMGAFTIDEVLEAVPGLHVLPSTLNRLYPNYTFRGIYTGQNAQVMFMLNGHRIYGDVWSLGISHLSRMNVNHIARIEVVRGPGSAIYGADAYSGVINIITKSAEELNGLHLGARTGTQNTNNVWLQYGTTLQGDWEIAMNLEYFEHDANTERLVDSDFQTNFDMLLGSNASLAPTYLDDRMKVTTFNIHANNRNWQIGLDGYINKDAGNGAGAAMAIDHDGNTQYNQYLFTLSYSNDQQLDQWRYSATFSYFYSDTQSNFNVFPANTVLPVGNDGNIFTPHSGVGCLTVNIPNIGCITTFSDGFIGNPQTTSMIPTLETTFFYEGWVKNQLRLNIGIKQEKLEASETKNFGPGILDMSTLNGSDNPTVVDGSLTNVSGTAHIFAPDKTRTVKHLSLQDIWSINENLTFTAGIRLDNYSDVGSTTNPRLALVWHTSDNLVTKLLYGEAFRAPSISELYAQNNPIALGNINLEPEKINTSELSFNYSFSEQLSSQINFYRFKSENMVEFVGNSQGVGTAQNVRNLTGEGLEFEASWQPHDSLILSANYAYQSTKNDLDDQQVEFVPKRQFYLDLRWKISEDWLMTGQYNRIMDRKRANLDLRPPLNDSEYTNIVLRRTGLDFLGANNSIELALVVKNLFDQKIFEPSDGKIPGDFPMHGRRVYAEFRCSF